MEPVLRIELRSKAYKAIVLPLNYTGIESLISQVLNKLSHVSGNVFSSARHSNHLTIWGLDKPLALAIFSLNPASVLFFKKLEGLTHTGAAFGSLCHSFLYPKL